MNISTRKLGLAAYIKLKGQVLVGFRDGRFQFDSDRSENDWEVEYLNTECYHHDVELINLRRLMKNGRGK